MWDLKLAPPAAIKKAIKRSVRRWRFKQIIADTPGLEPLAPDVRTRGSSNWKADTSTVLVDCTASALAAVCKNKAKASKKDEWEPKHKPYLVSAMAGGQWPQTRKARIEAWNIEDKRCQLCKEENGTLAHRFNCKATRPQNGWPQHPKLANFAMERLGPRRKEIMQIQGLACVKTPIDVRPAEGTFQWLTKPPDATRTDLVWYTDGSCSNPNCLEVARFGFAIVVVSDEGDLVAYGAGIPPAFVLDSGMAEVWALYTVIAEAPFIPRVVTDYLGIVSTARAGTTIATSSQSANARLWKMIAHRLDGDISQLADHVAWMPAHQSAAAIGTRYKSNNRAVSCLDFRANRLVDKLALHCATQSKEAKWGEVMVCSTKAATKHSLKLLGKVTYEANNHAVIVTSEDGTTKAQVIRDSCSAPARRPKAIVERKAKEYTVTESFTTDEVERLLSKVCALGRDQKKFGRRKLGAKRATATTASTAHPAGFKEFVSDEPVKLSALDEIRATARLGEAAAEATKQAESEERQRTQAKAKEKESEWVFLHMSDSVSVTDLPCSTLPVSTSNESCASTGPVVSVPSLSLLERATVFDGELRPRPTRTRGASSSSSVRDTNRALYSLLRGSK